MEDIYTYKERLILNETTTFCRDECSSREICPEDECILMRIEKIIVGDNEYE